MLEIFRDAMIDCYEEELRDINPYDEAGELNEGYFREEATEIIDKMMLLDKRDKYSAADVIQPVFKEKRGSFVSPYKCADMVDMLLDAFKSSEECIPFFEDSVLKSRMEKDCITPAMRVNEHFILDCFFVKNQGYLYINTKFFGKCPKKKTVDFYRSVLESDTVYVEYDFPRKNLSSYFKSQFKTYKREKYLAGKVKTIGAVKIFDRSGLLDII